MLNKNYVDERELRYSNIDLYAVRCNIESLVDKGHTELQAIKSVALKSGCHYKTLKKMLEENI